MVGGWWRGGGSYISQVEGRRRWKGRNDKRKTRGGKMEEKMEEEEQREERRLCEGRERKKWERKLR